MGTLELAIAAIRTLLESDILKSSLPVKLAKKTAEAYQLRSIRKAEFVEDRAIKDHYMKGLFVNEDVDWDLVKPKLNAYKENPSPLGEMIEKELGLDKKRIFPPKSIERDFASFCKAEIKFDSKLMSKPEVIDHLDNIREEANETNEWAKDLRAWLEFQKGYKFYYVVGFEITCEFDLIKYWKRRQHDQKKRSESAKKILDRIGSKGISVNKNKEKKQIEAEMHREAARLAEYAVEYVVEKIVFYDLRDAFKRMCEKLEKKKETADKNQAEGNNEKKEESQDEKKREKQENATETKANLSPESRFLFYNPLKLKLIATLGDRAKLEKKEESQDEKNREKQDDDQNNVAKIHLGDEIKATIRIETEAKPKFKIDKGFRVVIDEPSYFEVKETIKEITFVEEDQNYVDWIPEKGKNYVEKKDVCLLPKIDQITQKAREPEYPITFVLKRSTGILEKEGELVFAKRESQLARCCQNVTVLPPRIKLSMTKPMFPRKGEQFEVKFKVKCEGNSTKTLMIPVSIDLKSDFDVVASGATGTATGAATESEKIEINKEKEITFSLMAKRASFPGYYNVANFELKVGEWERIRKWRENMTIFPNLLDTIIAGGTTLLGVAYLYRPDLFPNLAAGLNIANLEAIPAIIYLGYRVLNWSKKTSG